MALSVSYTFSPTTVIESSQVNQNFSDIVNYINTTACVTGMVVAWSGSIASIPTGWALDNNLKDRMIIGAGNLYNPGDSGGEATHTLTVDEMPSHHHTINLFGSPGGPNVSYYNSQNMTTTTSTADTGGGQAHNNLPPYYAYAYIKKS